MNDPLIYSHRVGVKVQKAQSVGYCLTKPVEQLNSCGYCVQLAVFVYGPVVVDCHYRLVCRHMRVLLVISTV